MAVLAPSRVSLAVPPTMSDLWSNAAHFELANTGIGASFGFHFPSMIWEGSEIWAYYINWHDVGGVSKCGVGRARSSDGVNFTNDGLVLDVGGVWQWTWEAEGGSISHVIGRAESGGWSANTTQDSAGYLCFGPYTTVVPGGQNCASWKMMIDDNSYSQTVVTLDVYDATSATVLATKNVNRNQFSAANTYQVFNLNFTSTSGHQLEFRVYWQDKAYIKVDVIAISQGNEPFWDGTMASFPGIWKDGGTYYLVYEGSGTSPGDIGLATSTDGLHFVKSSINPILRHNTSGWEKANIGTPSLYKEGSAWYLFYHGFNGTDCQIGVATGTNLTSMSRYSGNPNIPTSSSGWDAGTVGRRTQVIKIGSYYYMGWEGSTDKSGGGFENCNWSSGFARSNLDDLLHWTKYPNNPIVPIVVGGFGNDGPEMIVINGYTYIYVRRSPTDRYLLRWNLPPAPGNPGATNLATTHVRWTWQDNSDNETGFKVYADPGAGPPTTLRTTTAANVTYWDYTSLTANTRYAFQVAGTNSYGDGAKTGNYARYTLASAASIGNSIACDKQLSTWYPAGATFTFSNPAGFGVGTHGGSQYKVSYYRYAWDKYELHTWNGSEPIWNGGTLALSPNAGDGSYRLHLQSWNGDDMANASMLNYGPFNYDGTPPTTTAMSAGGFYCEAQNVSLNVGETATIYYTTDGSEPTAGSSVYSSAIPINTSETLRFFAVDTAGNAESPNKQEVYTIITGGGSIAAAKQLGNGEPVSLTNKALYLKQESVGYIEELGRFSGIRIEGAISANEGDLVCLAGTMGTTTGGERYIALGGMASSGAGGAAPVAANNSAVKRGMMDGLYVTVWGTVKAGSVIGNSYLITDGSDDAGLKVVTPGAPGVNPGEFVVISGAAGFDGARVIYKR